MNSPCLQASKDTSEGIRFTPADIVRRRRVEWDGLRAETVEMTRLVRFEYGVRSLHHVLIAAERGEREDGESVVEGVQRSTQREFNRKMTFIPAGHCFHGWQEPRVLARCTYLYLDPAGPLIDPELRFSEIDFKPRLFFFDRDLWETAIKLKRSRSRTRGHQVMPARSASFLPMSSRDWSGALRRCRPFAVGWPVGSRRRSRTSSKNTLY
jgi:hypothetical protein